VCRCPSLSTKKISTAKFSANIENKGKLNNIENISYGLKVEGRRTENKHVVSVEPEKNITCGVSRKPRAKHP
jgi:hypothetical protein